MEDNRVKEILTKLFEHATSDYNLDFVEMGELKDEILEVFGIDVMEE